MAAEARTYPIWQRYLTSLPLLSNKGPRPGPLANFAIGQGLPTVMAGLVVFPNYGEKSFQWVDKTQQYSVITSTVTTNSTLTSNFTPFSDYTLNTTVSNSVAPLTTARTSALDYAQTNFGLTLPEAIASVDPKLSNCFPNCPEGAGVITEYTFTNFGPDITVDTSSVSTPISSTNASGPNQTITTNGNRTVVENVKITEVTTGSRTTDTTVTTSRQGTIDEETRIVGLSGFTDDSTADLQRTTDVRTETDGNIDEQITENTSTTKTTQNDTTVSERIQEQRRKEWKFKIAPTLFFDYSADLRIVNLGTHYPDMRIMNDPTGNFKHVTVIGNKGTSASPRMNLTGVGLGGSFASELPILNYTEKPKGPFWVMKRRDVSAGLGAALTYLQENATGMDRYRMGFLGLVPVASKRYLAEGLAPNELSAKKWKGQTIPQKWQDVSTWNTHDRVTYVTQGGLALALGYSSIPWGAGLSSYVGGDWAVEIQKLPGDWATARVTLSELKSKGAYLASGLIDYSYQFKINQSQTSFVFAFDLSLDQGQKALDSLLRLPENKKSSKKDKIGRIDELTALAKAGSKAVRSLQADEMIAEGRMRALNVGIPWAFWRWSKGDFHSGYTMNSAELGLRTEADLGLYIDSERSRFFGIDKLDKTTNLGFLAGISRETSVRGVKEEPFAQAFYSYRKVDATQFELKSAVQDVVRMTGLPTFFGLHLPHTQVTAPFLDLGYTEIQFVMNFDAQATAELLKIVSSRGNATGFLNIVDSLWKSYTKPASLILDDKQWDFCRPYGRLNGLDAAPHGSFGNAEDRKKMDAAGIEKCTKFSSEATSKAGAEMIASLVAMSKTLKSDKKEFAKAYARFGKAMLTNGVTFQAVLSYLKGLGMTSQYTILGEKIPAYDISIDWKTKILKF